MKRRLFPILFFCFLTLINLSAKKTPDWVKSRPIDNNYYIGIGVVTKVKNSNDHIQLAKDNALKNLASEITINVSGEVLSNVIEKSGILEEDIKSTIRTTTQADLEGFEIIDTYEDKENYWIYYRLSKNIYEKQKKDKVDKALNLAIDMFKEARSNENMQNIEKALLYYLQALKPLEKHIGETLKATINGKDVFLANEIYFAIQNLLSNIELKPKHSKIDAKLNKPLKKPLEIFSSYNADETYRVANLPLKFYFIKGSGDMIEEVRTNSSGYAKCEITKIKSSEKMQIVKSKLDISNFINQDSTSIIYQNMLKSFPIPETKFILNVKGLEFCIESIETNLGEKTEIGYIEPKLKEILSNGGYSFIEDITLADILIVLNANTNKGSESYGLFSAYADVSISVTDMDLGSEIYKKSFNRIKGIDADFKKAGLKALQNSSKKFEKIIPEIIQKL